MRPDVIVLIINFILYILAFLKFRSRSLLGIGSVVFLLYSVLALMSLLMVRMNPNTIYDVSFYAMIYLFVCIVITYLPLSRLSKSDYIVKQPNRRAINILFSIVSFFALLRFPNIVSNFNLVVSGFMSDSDLFYDTYMNAMESYTQVQGNSTYHGWVIISSMFDRFIPFFLLYYLTLKDRNIWITMGLIIGLVIAPMSGLINAQRGILVNTLFATIFAYSMFKEFYDKKVNHIVRVFGISFVSLIVLSTAIITISRFNQRYMASDYAKSSVFNYVGQAMVRFGQYGFDTGGIRYGDRTFPLVKKILFMDGHFDYAHRMAYYTNLKLNESVFSTFVGDFVVDFGPVFGFLIMVLLAIIFSKMISYKCRSVCLYQLLPAYIVGYILMCGWHLYPFADFGGNLSLFIGFILYFYFKRNKESVNSDN